MKIKKARKIHFKNRFKERVGYDISENQINNIKNHIISHGTPPRLGEVPTMTPGAEGAGRKILLKSEIFPMFFS